METIRALIQRIQEQSDRQAPPADILITVNALQSALQDVVADNVKKIRSGNISVVMPSANRVVNQPPPVQESSEAVGWRVKQKPQTDPEAERFVAASTSGAPHVYAGSQQPPAPEVPAKGALASQYSQELILPEEPEADDSQPDYDVESSAGEEQVPTREPGDWEKKPTSWQVPVRPQKTSPSVEDVQPEQKIASTESPVKPPQPAVTGSPVGQPGSQQPVVTKSPEPLQPVQPQQVVTKSPAEQPVQWQPAPPQDHSPADEPWQPKTPEKDLHAGYRPTGPKAAAQQEMDLRERNDIFSQSASLNDRHRPEHEEIGSALNDEPVKDLRKAIGINDRFVFLSELFRGDEVMYERSLKTINNFRIFPEAEYWIERELKVKLGWDENKAAVRHFRQLVRRRFQI